MTGAAAAGFDQAASGQNAEMAGNGGAAHWKARRELVDRKRRVPQMPQDLAANRIAESV